MKTIFPASSLVALATSLVLTLVLSGCSHKSAQAEEAASGNAEVSAQVAAPSAEKDGDCGGCADNKSEGEHKAHHHHHAKKSCEKASCAKDSCDRANCAKDSCSKDSCAKDSCARNKKKDGCSSACANKVSQEGCSSDSCPMKKKNKAEKSES